MSVDIIRKTKQIGELSARTLAAGQAQIDNHGSGAIARLAEDQSLRVFHTAQADLAQRACERWIELLYDGAPDTWWNVRDDGMIKKGTPWSRTRRKSYGLSEPQARLLYLIVGDLIGSLPERRQLYYKLPAIQRYALNRRFFPSVAGALEWQRTIGQVKPGLWHAYACKYPGGRR